MAYILSMEDEPHLQRLIQYTLQTAGHRVVVAEDGEQGLALVREQPPDLILLDLLMPKVDGITVLKVLKADASTAHIPILIVTASAQRHEAERAITLGADGYLIKPFRVTDLVEQVNHLLMAIGRFRER